MNDELIRGKRRLTETDAMWNLALGTVFEDERYAAFLSYRDAVKDAAEVITRAVDDWLAKHPQRESED